MEAAEYGLTARVRAIIEGDAGAMERVFSGYPLYPLYAQGWYTPLVFAAMHGRTETVRTLLERGADAGVRAPDGSSLYEIVREKGYSEIADMLEGHSDRDGL